MFSPHEEPGLSKEMISFPLVTERETFDRSFYHPSLTANQLSTEEIDNTLSQIERIYRKKEEHIFGTVLCGTFGLFLFHLSAYRFDNRFSVRYLLRRPLYRGINTLLFTAAGLYIWNQNSKAQDQAADLLEQVNKKTLPKGFRWYFPHSFSKIDLYPDDTYDPNQISTDENDRDQDSLRPPERLESVLEEEL